MDTLDVAQSKKGDFLHNIEHFKFCQIFFKECIDKTLEI